MNTNHPKFLALHQIRLPLPGLVSILHRFSGLLLFMALPLLLWMLQYSLRSIETYTMLVEVLRHPLSKFFLLLVLWAFLHHLCAGLRFLAIDLEWGVRLGQARDSSKWVLAAGIVLTAVLGKVLLW